MHLLVGSSDFLVGYTLQVIWKVFHEAAIQLRIQEECDLVLPVHYQLIR